MGIVSKLTEKAVIPFTHRCNSRMWFSKLHSPLFRTYFSWLSIANLNWNSPSPIFVIVISFPIFHTDLRRFFAALKFMFLVVWNLPTRLSEQCSNVFSRFSARTVITSPSSVVNLIFCKHAINSKCMLRKERKGKKKKRMIKRQSLHLAVEESRSVTHTVG